jgi:hypothetical protein
MVQKFRLLSVIALFLLALVLVAYASEENVEENNDIDDFEVLMEQEDDLSMAAKKKKKAAPKKKKAKKPASKKGGSKGGSKGGKKPKTPKAPASGGLYQLFPALNGLVQRWSCDPITYRVNVQYADDKKAALSDAKGAVARISKASGLRFQYLGSTTELCQTAQTVTSAHMVINWHPKGATFFNGVAGKGGFYPTVITDTTGQQRASISRGCVSINTSTKLRPGFGSAYRNKPGGGWDAYSVRGHVLLHEIMHAMGMDHVNSEAEIMNPVADLSRKPVKFGPGDLRGLAVVGKDGCFYIPGGRV